MEQETEHLSHYFYVQISFEIFEKFLDLKMTCWSTVWIKYLVYCHLTKVSITITCKTHFLFAYENKYQETNLQGFKIEQVCFCGSACITCKYKIWCIFYVFLNVVSQLPHFNYFVFITKLRRLMFSFHLQCICCCYQLLCYLKNQLNFCTFRKEMSLGLKHGE